MQVFLSHATADRALVAVITKRLAAAGATTYATEHDNKAGVNVHEKIQSAISASDIMVVMLTPAGCNSRYVHQEIGFARSAGKLIVPLVTAETASTDLGMLQGVEYIRIDEAEPSSAVERLNERIAELSTNRTSSNPLLVAGILLIFLGAILYAAGQ